MLTTPDGRTQPQDPVLTAPDDHAPPLTQCSTPPTTAPRTQNPVLIAHDDRALNQIPMLTTTDDHAPPRI